MDYTRICMAETISNSMKFLVTGSSGLVGNQVIKDLTNQDHKVFSCYHDAKPTFGQAIFLDLADKQSIIDVMKNTKPDIVIHLAAMTNVDLCETQKDLAIKINADATETLAKEAAKQNAFFVYISTDYVFDGKDGMKKESDEPNPLGMYGKSKLEGERKVQNLASSWAIARISTPFGVHPTKKSFPIWVKENLEKNQQINVLVDQFTSPTYVPNLSKMIIEITTRQIVGILHISGASKISRYEFAEQIADKLSLDKKLINPSSMNDMNWIAMRPKDSSLDVSKANEILNEKPQTIKESLEFFTKSLL